MPQQKRLSCHAKETTAYMKQNTLNNQQATQQRLENGSEHTLQVMFPQDIPSILKSSLITPVRWEVGWGGVWDG